MAEPVGPTLAGHSTPAAFLDAPGVEPGSLLRTVAGVLDGMPGGAVLTVYTDAPAARTEMAAWAAAHHVELVAVITQGADGATFVLRRSGEAPTQAP